MPESAASRRMRWGFNFFPAFRGTGARVTYISGDFREVRVELPLNWRTRNYVGTIFGGSLYGAVDPHYMIMLIKILGPDYTVWDKAATIRFRKPGRGKLFARFAISEEEIAQIRQLTEASPSIDRVYNVDLTDAAGIVHASVEKTVYIRRNPLSHSGTGNSIVSGSVGS
jgi:acyl-coenzyme A thioesterase PaaI-like protein